MASPGETLVRSATTLVAPPSTRPAPASSERLACFHCGEPCFDRTFHEEDHVFCCQGCQFVHQLLSESGLGRFYELSQHPGVRVSRPGRIDQWVYLDDPALQQKLLDFTDGKTSRITLHIPAIHCVACVWLLENLFRLKPGVGRSRVNFGRREVSIVFSPDQLKLSELVSFLVALGYEPSLTLGQLDGRKSTSVRKKQWLQVGVAGFAFGNIMLFSLPLYLGLDSASGPLFRKIFGYLSLLLALPVLLYSASDYWRAAWVAFRQRVMTLDVPIALGLAALYGQSAFEIFFHRGEGYLDSLAGLVFLLLCGRAFQQKTQERIVFDRDYKCFFPLAVTRLVSNRQESTSISNVQVGDHLLLRNGELLPCDSMLVNGEAVIDYSFVTGESESVKRVPGDHLYAGGRQIGAAIEVKVVKPVSQSYLTSLWSDEAFQKDRDRRLDTLTNQYSRRFTWIVVAIAICAAASWISSGDTSRGIKAFTSVLIVACPCALALAAPFTLGTAQRVLARSQVFLRDCFVLEDMSRVTDVIFDKTGTLTQSQAKSVAFIASSANTARFSEFEKSVITALARQSTHPHSVKIYEWLAADSPTAGIQGFAEFPGRGLEGTCQGHVFRLGSRAWLGSLGLELPEPPAANGSVVACGVDNRFLGFFVLENRLRPELNQLIEDLAPSYRLTLLSGDNARERDRFADLLGPTAKVHFDQSPKDKLDYVRGLQGAGARVMMVGDGLNDAGALKQSDVGIAVVEAAGAFSPASDVVMGADQLVRMHRILNFARRSVRIVRLSFALSALYNLAGISIAAAGVLSPLICAVLMPASSVSVVLFACGATNWAAKKTGLAG